MRSVSVAVAKRHFTSLLRRVAHGEQITVTSRGKPVATIAAADCVARPERVSARRLLLSRLRRACAFGTRNWSRDDLYR